MLGAPGLSPGSLEDPSDSASGPKRSRRAVRRGRVYGVPRAPASSLSGGTCRRFQPKQRRRYFRKRSHHYIGRESNGMKQTSRSVLGHHPDGRGRPRRTRPPTALQHGLLVQFVERRAPAYVQCCEHPSRCGRVDPRRRDGGGRGASGNSRCPPRKGLAARVESGILDRAGRDGALGRHPEALLVTIAVPVDPELAGDS